jgi:hypothetical protein
MLQTEHEFVLPMGLIDKEGMLHRDGVMRLATAADEIHPLKDPRVQKNPAYLTVILLSRVVRRIGGIEPVTPNLIEELFAADLSFLQTLYNEINRVDEPTTVTCPQCQHAFAMETALAGGFSATPSISSTRR